MDSRGFNFCFAMRKFCVDVCLRHPEFRHIDMSRVVVTYAQARSAVEWGMQAKLTPMRFERGAMTEKRDGQTFTVQRLFHQQTEMLYILTFYLPRFLNQTYMEKLVTVFHELYHISPQFDGDIRRFSGPCYMHTGSQAEYDRMFEIMLSTGTAERLNDAARPNSYLVQSDPADVARLKKVDAEIKERIQRHLILRGLVWNARLRPVVTPVRGHEPSRLPCVS